MISGHEVSRRTGWVGAPGICVSPADAITGPDPLPRSSGNAFQGLGDRYGSGTAGPIYHVRCRERLRTNPRTPRHITVKRRSTRYSARMPAGLPRIFAESYARKNGRVVAFVVLLFWLSQYAVVTALDHLSANVGIVFLPRILISSSGFVISLMLAQMWFCLSILSLAGRSLTMIVLAAAGAAAQTYINFTIFRLVAPEMGTTFTTIDFFRYVLHWFWIFGAMAGAVLAIDFGRALADHERRIAVLGRAATQAHLRALRYQLNPHFMFNTLNSIAALVERNDANAAGAMVQDLSDFLRVTLSMDPEEDITLARELELQSLYLAIETQRFPDRLAVMADVTAEAASAMVPSLIIQPLAENVVRHAVAQTMRRITMKVTGRRLGDNLQIVVANSAPDGASRGVGTQVGLANVAQRLDARFGSSASITTTTQSDGGFTVTVTLPLLVAS